MLGTLSEAEDVVQEAFYRYGRIDPAEVDALPLERRDDAGLPEAPEHFTPGYDPGELAEIAKKMMTVSRNLESDRVLVAGLACRLASLRNPGSSEEAT
jgi:hypothetical protein